MSRKDYRRLAEQVATREAGFRENVGGITDMNTSLTQFSAQTGAPGTLDYGEIPSVAGLANFKAVAETASQQREDSVDRRRKQLPSYVSSYRKYLKWRYPTRYGDRGSQTYSGVNLPQFEIPDIPLPRLPEFK